MLNLTDLLLIASIFSPAASRSSTPVISMRVYLKVGRYPQIPTARTIYSPRD